MKKSLLYLPLPILFFLLCQLTWTENTTYILTLGILLGANLVVLWVKRNGQ